MNVDKFMYFWPPRAKTSVKFGSDHQKKLADSNLWVAQFKLNGQRNLTYIDPDGNFQFWNRHKEEHRSYSPPDFLRDELRDVLGVERGKWSVFDGELLHLKDKTIKNTIYLFDVLVFNGKFLLNSTYFDRHQLLRETTGTTDASRDDIAIKPTKHVWVADTLRPNEWDDAWKHTDISYIEGFVFKKVDARLKPCIVEKNNTEWQIRCRKPTKNYQF